MRTGFSRKTGGHFLASRSNAMTFCRARFGCGGLANVVHNWFQITARLASCSLCGAARHEEKEAGMRFAKLWAGSAVALALSAGASVAETGGHAVPWQM